MRTLTQILPPFLVVPPTASEKAGLVEGKPQAFHDCLERVMGMPRSVSGERGHDAIFAVACEIARWAVSGNDAFEIISKFNSDRCDPEWPPTDLKRKLREGHKRCYREGEIGCRLHENASSLPEFTEIPPGEPQPAVVEPGNAKPEEWSLDIAPDGFDSVIGRYVLANDPHTESDKNVVLMRMKSLFGNVIGRRAYMTIDTDRHHAKQNLVVVGRTGERGRKGTSYTNALAPFAEAFPDWRNHCITKFSSGEAIISKLRDPEETSDEEDPTQIRDYRRECLWRATEFAETLTHIKRDGSIAGIVLIDSWDDVVLERNVVDRKDSFKASNTHISVQADITQTILQAEFKPRYLSSGFANRFYFVVSVPRKRVDYDDMSAEELCVLDSVRGQACSECARQLREAFDWLDELQPGGPGQVVTQGVEFAMGESCKELNKQFKEEYRKATDNDELVTELYARGANIVKRSAMVEAILDRSRTIEAKHLKAAIAEFWYAKACGDHIFSYLSTTQDVVELEALYYWALRQGSVLPRDVQRCGPQAFRRSTESATQGLNDLVKLGRGVWGEWQQNPKGGPKFRAFIPNRI